MSGAKRVRHVVFLHMGLTLGPELVLFKLAGSVWQDFFTYYTSVFLAVSVYHDQSW